MAKLTFLGAAGCVTGSKYLVEAAGKKLLVDCGLFQGTEDLKERNWHPLPVDLKTIDYGILTHAHLDHTGWLPVLVRDGFRRPIFANPATIELTELLVKDSGHLQEEETANAIKHKWSEHPEPRTLYTSEDVDPMLQLLKPMPRRGGFDISPEFHVESYDAGHILGSSSLELTITENGKKSVIIFSGDIGRYDQPILNDPTTPATKQIDLLLCESTYGDRDHEPGDPMGILEDIVNRVAKRGGSVVIPAFAIGRTQTFMYYLRQLENLHPPDRKRRDNDGTTPLRHPIHDVLKNAHRIARFMIPVAIGRFAQKKIDLFRRRRRWIVQDRLVISSDISRKNNHRLFSVFRDR